MRESPRRVPLGRVVDAFLADCRARRPHQLRARRQEPHRLGQHEGGLEDPAGPRPPPDCDEAVAAERERVKAAAVTAIEGI